MTIDPMAVARLCADYNTRIAALEVALADLEARCDNISEDSAQELREAYARIAELEAALAAAKKDADLLWANCRVIYFPKPAGTYPIEHVLNIYGGDKDSREDIITALRRDAAIAKEGER